MALAAVISFTCPRCGHVSWFSGYEGLPHVFYCKWCLWELP